ncbi:Methyltransferase gedG [Paramyrothecium foliicola]|nr:Methyltransferase gedG [Paramyrothecium foliicola]
MSIGALGLYNARRYIKIPNVHVPSKILRELPKSSVSNALFDLIHGDGAGSWPPLSAHDNLPPSLQPYADIYDEISKHISTSTPSLDNHHNIQLIQQFRGRLRVLLAERVNLREVGDWMGSVEAGQWTLRKQAQCNAFYCTIAMLRHAYRWATVPIVRVAQIETKLDIPQELDVPWQYLQKHFGCAAESGNNTANVLHNFDGGGQMRFRISIGVSEQISSTESSFFSIFHNIEVKAGPVDLLCLAIDAYQLNDRAACIERLSNVTSLLRPLFQVFYQSMLDSNVRNDCWLRYCQGFQGWGLEKIICGKTVRHEGLSGNHVLVFQVLDAFLGYQPYLSDEDMKLYIPARQRNFIEAVRKHSFKSKVTDEDIPEIREELSKIVQQLKNEHSNVAYKVEKEDHPFTIEESDWEDYEIYRPKYPPSMWDAWIDYHKAHGGLSDAAHDIGAGSGIAAKELSRFFSHIFVSDPGESNIMAARRLLRPAENFTFCRQAAELPWLGKETIDFASICEALHWMDSEAVLRNVAASLRPGGTLAICTYGLMIRFPMSPKLEDLWVNIFKTAVGGFLKTGDIGPAERKGMRKFIGGLDGTAIPGDLFTDVIRIQVNFREEGSKAFCFVPEGTVEPPSSQIGMHEDLQHLYDPGWRREVDLAWLKGYLASTNMPFGQKIWQTPNWREFETVMMHEFGGQTIVEWPVAMILATRR